MVKKTQKPKGNQSLPRLRALRSRANRIRNQGTGAGTSTAHPKSKKSSIKERMTAKNIAKAAKKSIKRGQSSVETRSRRKSLDSLGHARARSEAPDDVATKRRRLDATRKRRTRSEETEQAYRKRTSSNATVTARTRSQESGDMRGKRKAQDAERKAETRSKESKEVSETRKTADRLRHASHRGKQLGIARKDVEVEEDYLGKMTLQCSSCQALHFEGELPQSKKFNTCCRHGLVQLPMFESFPNDLQQLFVGSTPEALDFQKNIRNYNNSMAMGSMVAKLDTPRGGGPYTFRLHGQVYHVIGALHPDDGKKHEFAQVFILDTTEAAEQLANRKINQACSKELYKKLIGILHEHNPFVKSFKMMHEKEEEEEMLATTQNREPRNVKMVFREGKNLNKNRYQLPTAEEVAVVFVGDEDEIPGKRVITVYQRNTSSLQYLQDTDKETDPLCYPLLFVDGRYGWHIGQKRKGEHGGETKMSAREFYSYYLHTRPTFNPLHHAKKLFQQFCVDVWTKIEQDRLNFIRRNQDMLRVESIQGLMDHASADDGGPCGKRVFLPGTFTGSPRDMVAQFQDALTVVSRFGKPDLFITVTCNPNWKEIQESLLPGQIAVDRPDIVSRVFKLKVEQIKKDLFVNQIFGEVAAWIYVVEFQKRGLPHMHLLMILKDSWKPRTTAEVDEIVSAELLDETTDPELYRIVSTMMIHRPCGIHNPSSPCMSEGMCSKHFPKEFRSSTSIETDGFPLYKRHDDGRKIAYKSQATGTVYLDNRHVVPYNRYLSRKYQCHANVEICGNVGAVKYLYKYVYKGTTRAAVHIYTDKDGVSHRKEDEINTYLDTRYVCAPEALHHIFEFKMAERSTPVVQLKVHLKDAQGIVFKSGEEKEALKRNQLRETTLTAWFSANQRCYDEIQTSGMIPDDVVDSRGIHYIEMPEHFQFSNGKWIQRKRATKCIGRMHFVSPRDQERFALRLLLLNTVDAKSYEDLQTVGGVHYEKFVDAAKAAGYLTDDGFYEKSLDEASTFHSAPQLRSFFVTLLMFGEVHNAEELWFKFLDHFCEDFLYKHFPREKAEALAYNDIIDRVSSMGEKIEKWMNLGYERIIPDDVIDFEFCEKEGERMRETLAEEQEKVVKVVLESLENGGGQIFVDGPGGSGKTYVYLCLLNILKGMHKKVIPVAWTGIAAALLPHGRTVASFFHLNISDGCKSSSIHLQSNEAKQLANLDVIMWDEAPMSPKTSLETVDQLLRDVTQSNLPFGGKTIILGGDYRQCLPVMDKKGKEEQIANSIKKSKLWPLFKTVRLTANMRVNDGNKDWMRFLLEIGDGIRGEESTGLMEIPEELRCNDDLAEEIFGVLLRNEARVSDISKVAILSPTNQQASEMNKKVLDMIHGEMKVFKSIDEIGDKQETSCDAINFPTEFLHKLTPSGLPPHLLELKIGTIIMLIRNIDVRNGLCNGTRLVVREMGERVLRCAFISGPNEGGDVLLPRIKLSFDKGIPFVLQRLQFPVRPAFAMTVNKAQGQTFDRIGLLLDHPIFSHGQFYVAISRTRTKEGIKISSPDNMVNNIVFKEIL